MKHINFRTQKRLSIAVTGKATRTSVNILYAILAQYPIFKYPYLVEYNKIETELAAATDMNYRIHH